MNTEQVEQLAFSKKLAENLDDLDDRVFRKNFASLIIVDGGVGTGKTTLDVHIMDYINKKHSLDLVDLTDKTAQLSMGGEDFTNKLTICFGRKLPICTYDEAGDFHKRGSMTRLNALINRTFETYRAFKIIVILSLPVFNVLDQDIFDKEIPRLLIHIYHRSMNQADAKCYSLKGMLRLRAKMEKLKHFKKLAYNRVEPNFFIHVKNLPEDRRHALDVLSTRGKIKGLKQASIKFEGLLSYVELSKKVGRSEVWVRKTLKELKVRSVKTFERRNYFPAEAVDQLLDFMDDKGK
jgi:hypothetical protein